MPELTEVETTRRGIAPYVRNQRIRTVTVRDGRLRWPVPANLGAILVGALVTGVRRRAKYLLIDTDRYNVTRAIAAGLAARMMSALAEEADRDLDLRGLGRLLAMTSNDEANALATNRFPRVFGRRGAVPAAPGRPRGCRIIRPTAPCRAVHVHP